MRLLVTGGCGFIGSHFVRHMLERYTDVQITNIDNLTYAGSEKNLGLQRSNPNYEFYKADICTVISDSFKCTFNPNLAREFDWIVNFAAQTHVDRSIDNAYPFLKTNVIGTHALLEFARRYKINFLQVSTDEAYGEVLSGTSKEDAPLRPSSPYGVSKVAADMLVLSYHRTYQLPFIITRSANNYGPCQYPEKLIPLFIIKISRGEKVGLYGDGMQIREWIWVEDHVRAIDLLIQKAGPYIQSSTLNKVYNIGTGELFTNLEVTKRILRYFGHDRSSIDFIADRKGHDRRYAMNSEKIREWGWEPHMPFDVGLPQTIEWYESHRDWWGKGDLK